MLKKQQGGFEPAPARRVLPEPRCLQELIGLLPEADLLSIAFKVARIDQRRSAGERKVGTPLAMIPCFAGGTPVVSVACTEQVTAGQLGCSVETGLLASHRPKAVSAGTLASSSRLNPGRSIKQTRDDISTPSKPL